MIQGGDIGPRNDGTGGCSIWKRDFPGKRSLPYVNAHWCSLTDLIIPDESFHYSHDRGGLLSMANRGPDTNSSQVRVTLHFFPHGSTLCFI